MEQYPIEIKISKIKILLGTLGSIIFVLLCIWLISSYESLSFIKLIFVKIIGIIGVVFFSGTLMFGLAKLFDDRIGVIINKEGIIDNSSGSSVGLILWNDIENIRVGQVVSTRFLLIDVKNPEKYIDRMQDISPIKFKLLQLNYKTYGTPLSISTNTLKMKFTDMEKLIRREHAKLKQPQY